MSKKKAKKNDVLEKLDASIRFCNSHRDDVQTLFDGLVDNLIDADARPADYAIRQEEMKSLFPIVLDPNTKGFIPTIGMNEEDLDLEPHDFLELWLSRWISKFVDAWKTLPSQRIANPKGSVTDHALIKMIAPHVDSGEKAEDLVKYHNLFMSAENIGGELLEEYIASKVEQYDWIWCRGKILTAVDFCNKSCTEFVQIKNKENTENSPGRGFRIDHGAPSWFRMYSKKKSGKIATRWPDLMEIIKRGAKRYADNIPDDLLNEDDYLQFIESASLQNPAMITSEEK